MKPRRSCALVVIFAAGWLVVGLAAAGAAAQQEPETAVVPQSGTPPSESPEQEIQPERENPARATSLPLAGRTVRLFLFLTKKDDDDWEEGLEGTLVGADEDSLRVRHDDRVLTLPRKKIRRLEVAPEGPKPVNPRRLCAGAGIGVGAGLGAGAIAAYALAGGISGDPDADVVGPLLIGGVLGAGIGALLAHETRGPAWTEVPLERVHVGLLPAVGRRGLGLTLVVGF